LKVWLEVLDGGGDREHLFNPWDAEMRRAALWLGADNENTHRTRTILGEAEPRGDQLEGRSIHLPVTGFRYDERAGHRYAT
jgi:hypothetical protein